MATVACPQMLRATLSGTFALRARSWYILLIPFGGSCFFKPIAFTTESKGLSNVGMD
jgi:hypothetical protein